MNLNICNDQPSNPLTNTTVYLLQCFHRIDPQRVLRRHRNSLLNTISICKQLGFNVELMSSPTLQIFIFSQCVLNMQLMTHQILIQLTVEPIQYRTKIATLCLVPPQKCKWPGHNIFRCKLNIQLNDSLNINSTQSSLYINSLKKNKKLQPYVWYALLH